MYHESWNLGCVIQFLEHKVGIEPGAFLLVGYASHTVLLAPLLFLSWATRKQLTMKGSPLSGLLWCLMDVLFLEERWLQIHAIMPLVLVLEIYSIDLNGHRFLVCFCLVSLFDKTKTVAVKEIFQAVNTVFNYVTESSSDLEELQWKYHHFFPNLKIKIWWTSFRRANTNYKHKKTSRKRNYSQIQHSTFVENLKDNYNRDVMDNKCRANWGNFDSIKHWE